MHTYPFNFTGVNIINGTQYFFEVERTGTTTSSAYYYIGIASNLYNGGKAYENEGVGNWRVYSSDMYFVLKTTNSANVIWNETNATEVFTKMAISAFEVLNTGTITYYVSNDGTNWTQITSLNEMQAVSFTGTNIHVKAVITGDAELNSIAWGGY